MRFSERIGVNKEKSFVQINSMDDDLRNSLWSLIILNYFDRYSEIKYSGYQKKYPYASGLNNLAKSIWLNFFKKPVDQIPGRWNQVVGTVRDYFFTANWADVYDFVEFIPNSYVGYEANLTNSEFITVCNRYLKREMSAYRFAGNHLAKLIDENEIAEVEIALKSGAKGAKTHIEKAVVFMSDRKSPDYRNSIKESITAVEHVCREITGESSLGSALKKLQSKVHVNDQLRKGFESLYSYTNSKEGIRHAIMEDSEIGFDEAKFMLVACSAFTNYIASKNNAS